MPDLSLIRDLIGGMERERLPMHTPTGMISLFKSVHSGPFGWTGSWRTFHHLATMLEEAILGD